MTSIRKSTNLSVFALITVLMTVIAYQAGGRTHAVAPESQPAARGAVVATVNLNAVFEGLAQSSEAQAHMQDMSQKMIAERDAYEERLTAMRTQLEELNKGREPGAMPSEAEIELAEKLELEMLNFQAWAQFANEKLDVEIGLQYQALYRAVREAVNDMARTEGYDLVLMDDSMGEFAIDPNSRLPREAQIRQQAAARTILFASPRVDITADLVARMNNQFRANR